jgi:hypothetical protein
MKLYTSKVQQKHKAFVVSGFMLFTQPSFMLIPCFWMCKKYETKTRKRYNQKHETFVVSGLVLLTQQKD